MGDFIRSVQGNAILQAILFIVLGAILLIFPDITLIAVVICIGAIFALSGIIYLVLYFMPSSKSYHASASLTTGVFCLLIAIVMFIFPVAAASFFSILFGGVLILCGVTNIIRAASLKAAEGPLWVIGCALGALTVIGGIIIIWNPFETSSIFVMALGIILIVNGISDLVVELAARKNIEAR